MHYYVTSLLFYITSVSAKNVNDKRTVSILISKMPMLGLNLKWCFFCIRILSGFVCLRAPVQKCSAL